MPIEIRPSVAADADELGAVHVAAWRAAYRGIVPDDHLDNLDPVANAERRRHSFADGRPRVPELVAVVDGRIAGFTAYGRPRDEVPDGWGELWVINLHPDFWRQGIGSLLFAAAVDGLRELGYRRGYLWVIEGNDRAVEFYRRQGWHPDGARKTDLRFGPAIEELRCSAALGGPDDA